jgi:hypothetical protein
MSFRTIEPKILYFGTPVALVSSLNEDGTTNLAPISYRLADRELGKTFRGRTIGNHGSAG